MVKDVDSSAKNKVEYTLFDFIVWAPGKQTWNYEWAENDFTSKSWFLDHHGYFLIQFSDPLLEFEANLGDVLSFNEHEFSKTSTYHQVVKNYEGFLLHIIDVDFLRALGQVVIFDSIMNQCAYNDWYYEVHALSVLYLQIN